MKEFTVRQWEIINAALDIIAKLGMEGMTIKNLARAVKVSEPAIYRHFGSKYQILSSILLYYRQFLLEIFDQKAGPGSNHVDAIGFLYQELFKSFKKHPQLSMIQFSEELFLHDRRLSQEALDIVELMHDKILGILKAGVRGGKIRTNVPVKHMAWMVMGTMRMLITRWRISGYSFDLVREGQQVFDYIRKILKA
jgi:TetR/AcrR family fatty acid metabolism transcriptional regulator